MISKLTIKLLGYLELIGALLLGIGEYLLHYSTNILGHAENYVSLVLSKLFKLPGRFLIQKEDHTFVPTEKESGVENPYFGIAALLSDFNTDRHLDLIWTNINGPLNAFINKGNTNNFVQVDLVDDAEAMGAKVTVVTPERILTDWMVTGEGLASDQTALLHFGFGTSQRIDKTTILTVKKTRSHPLKSIQLSM